MLSDSSNKQTKAANGRRKALQVQKVPEASVLRACCDLLTAERIWWCRMNTGAVRDGKRFFRFGKLGMADILALPKSKIRCNDDYWISQLVLWIECKSSEGRQTLEQDLFQREVEKEGHHYLLVRDVDTLRNWLKEHGCIGGGR